MDEFESLSHTKWDCKYHIVFIPKYRRKSFTVSCGRIWARFSETLPHRKKAGSKRVI